jgi:hypothetical protein
MNRHIVICILVLLCSCVDSSIDDTDIVSQGVTVTPAFQAAGPLASGTSNVIVAWPTEQAGDVGLMLVETANQAVAAPAGWLAVAGSPQGTGLAGNSTATRLTVFYKRALSSSEGQAGLLDAGDHIVAQILTFRGCAATGLPWDVASGDTSSTSTIVVMPSGTTTVDDTLVVQVVSNGTDTTTAQTSTYSNSSLANLTEVSDRNDIAGNGGGFGVVTGGLAMAGPFAHTVAALQTASAQGRMSIALRP